MKQLLKCKDFGNPADAEFLNRNTNFCQANLSSDESSSNFFLLWHFATCSHLFNRYSGWQFLMSWWNITFMHKSPVKFYQNTYLP